MDRATTALVNTLILLLIIPFVGFIINTITDATVRILQVKLGRKLTIFISNYLTFIGTVHHELSHVIFAWCTGAKIVEVKLFSPSNGTLGQVTFNTRGNKIMRAIQLTMTSIAPIVCGCLTEYMLIKYAFNTSLNNIIIYYLIFSIFMHMTMSKQDIKNAIKGLPICTFIAYLILYITRFNILTII